jgi:uncharacterized membrane protein
LYRGVGGFLAVHPDHLHLRYAHRYYQEEKTQGTDGPARGSAVAGPTLIISILPPHVVGMTSKVVQVSEAQVTSREMRHPTLVHSAVVRVQHAGSSRWHQRGGGRFQ